MTELSPRREGTAPQLLSPLALAFVGDGVYELLAREYLLTRGNAPVGKLHSRAVELVSANAQAEAYRRIQDLLTPEEEAVYRRGRNANSASRCPRNTDPAVYHRATGLEALFGWLYLSGRIERVNELFSAVLESREAGEKEEL